jgi:hypothetical protein
VVTLENNLVFPQKVKKTELPSESEIPLLSIHPKEMKINISTKALI